MAVDLSTWASIREFGPERFARRLADLTPDIVFASERELEELGDEADGGDARAASAAPKASIVETGGTRAEHPAVVADVVDSTGAGDALAAGFLVGGIEVGLEAAARCLGKLGTMP